MPITQSLLDTDLYKFTMMQAVLHQHPGAQVQYRFKCRTPGIDLARYIDQIDEEIDHLCSLRFSDAELDYMRGLRFVKPDFADFLGLFHLDRKYIQLRASTAVPGEIELDITGPWLHTILFEVPLLAIINEVWFRNTTTADFAEGERRLQAKAALLRDTPGFEQCRIADYGSRRRYSRDWHARLLPLLRDALGPQLVGTSNVHFARLYGMTPHGTMAHEYLQAFGRSARACVIRRWRHWNRGRASTVAIWASRCPTWSARTRSCATSTCISASCSTVCAMTPAIRSTGATACWRTSSSVASIHAARCWCSAMGSTSPRSCACTTTSAVAARSRSASAPT